MNLMYYVFIDGELIPNKTREYAITDIRFKSSIDGKNELELRIEISNSNNILPSYFSAGRTIDVFWEYKNKIGFTPTMMIGIPECDFGARRNVKIHCIDLILQEKVVKRNTTILHPTINKLGMEIASDLNLTFSSDLNKEEEITIDDTERSISNSSRFSLLNNLSKKSNAFVYVNKYNTLRIVKINFDKDIFREYDYFSKKERKLLRFSPTILDYMGETFHSFAKLWYLTEQGNLSELDVEEESFEYNVGFLLKNKMIFQKAENLQDVIDNIREKVLNNELLDEKLKAKWKKLLDEKIALQKAFHLYTEFKDAKKKGIKTTLKLKKSATMRSKLRSMKAKIELDGDPEIVPEKLIKINNSFPFASTYYVFSVEHNLKPNDYTTVIEGIGNPNEGLSKNTDIKEEIENYEVLHFDDERTTNELIEILNSKSKKKKQRVEERNEELKPVNKNAFDGVPPFPSPVIDRLNPDELTEEQRDFLEYLHSIPPPTEEEIRESAIPLSKIKKKRKDKVNVKSKKAKKSGMIKQELSCIKLPSYSWFKNHKV